MAEIDLKDIDATALFIRGKKGTYRVEKRAGENEWHSFRGWWFIWIEVSCSPRHRKIINSVEAWAKLVAYVHGWHQ